MDEKDRKVGEVIKKKKFKDNAERRWESGRCINEQDVRAKFSVDGGGVLGGKFAIRETTEVEMVNSKVTQSTKKSQATKWTLRRVQEILAINRHNISHAFGMELARGMPKIAKVFRDMQAGGVMDWGTSIANDMNEHLWRTCDKSLAMMVQWESMLQDAGKVHIKHEVKASREEWKEKVNESVKKGTSLAYRLIKEPPGLALGYVVTKTGEKLCSQQAVIEEQRQIWAGWWAQDKEKPGDDLDLSQLPRVRLPGKIDPELLRKVARSFKEATSCVDGWHQAIWEPVG